jgi:hypothetical protein
MTLIIALKVYPIFIMIFPFMYLRNLEKVIVRKSRIPAFAERGILFGLSVTHGIRLRLRLRLRQA